MSNVIRMTTTKSALEEWADGCITIEETKVMLKCGHTKVYELIKEGRLVATKLGRGKRAATRVSVRSIRRMLAESVITPDEV